MLLSRERNNSIERVNEANNNRATTVLKGKMRIITTAAVVLEGPGSYYRSSNARGDKKAVTIRSSNA